MLVAAAAAALLSAFDVDVKFIFVMHAIYVQMLLWSLLLLLRDVHRTLHIFSLCLTSFDS